MVTTPISGLMVVGSSILSGGFEVAEASMLGSVWGVTEDYGDARVPGVG